MPATADGAGGGGEERVPSRQVRGGAGGMCGDGRQLVSRISPVGWAAGLKCPGRCGADADAVTRSRVRGEGVRVAASGWPGEGLPQ
jgi:hypothetical protein